MYTSLLAGPRRSGEPDGPEEFYLVLLDNGRTKLLADAEKRESLYCIRCGACLNACPVYRKIGGHSYPWVYSGPIGKIITPQFMGVDKDPWLPFASSLCGACAEVCPVKINIPKILLTLRQEVTESRTRDGSNRSERTAFRMWAWVMRHPRLYENLATMGSGMARAFPSLVAVGPLKAWLSQRDLPPTPNHSFRDLWKHRNRGVTKGGGS